MFFPALEHKAFKMHSKVCDLRAQLQHDQTAKLVVTETAAYARAILSHTYSVPVSQSPTLTDTDTVLCQLVPMPFVLSLQSKGGRWSECRRCRPQSMSAACQLRSPVAVGPPPNAVWLLLSSAPFLALLTRSGVVYLVGAYNYTGVHNSYCYF